MKRILIKFGKFSLALAGLLFLAASSAFAQLSLREALDFDMDGKADYIIFRPATNTWWVLKSDGSGYQTQQFSGFSLYTRDYFTLGDYDGDNKADYSVWRNSNATWYQYRSSTNTLSTASFGTSGDEPVARDYDGDGKTDFAVVSHIPPSPTPTPAPPPAPTPTPAPPGQLVWSIKRSSNGVVNTTQFGYDTDVPAPGDYDGDGKFDIAIQRPGVGHSTQSVFWILRSSDNIAQSVSFGFGDDSVVPGDYDGDGKSDIAVVRDGVTSSQNIVWYIQQSTAGFKAVSFGLTGSDKPAQGDYDGDNKTDIAVWRETDGKFYVLRSSDNGLSVLSWGTFGDFPVAGYDTH
jgi:hypothetical protein